MQLQCLRPIFAPGWIWNRNRDVVGVLRVSPRVHIKCAGTTDTQPPNDYGRMDLTHAPSGQRQAKIAVRTNA